MAQNTEKLLQTIPKKFSISELTGEWRHPVIAASLSPSVSSCEPEPPPPAIASKLSPSVHSCKPELPPPAVASSLSPRVNSCTQEPWSSFSSNTSHSPCLSDASVDGYRGKCSAHRPGIIDNVPAEDALLKEDVEYVFAEDTCTFLEEQVSQLDVLDVKIHDDLTDSQVEADTRKKKLIEAIETRIAKKAGNHALKEAFRSPQGQERIKSQGGGRQSRLGSTKCALSQTSPQDDVASVPKPPWWARTRSKGSDSTVSTAVLSSPPYISSCMSSRSHSSQSWSASSSVFPGSESGSPTGTSSLSVATPKGVDRG